MSLTQEQLEQIKKFQKNEITEYYIYQKLAERIQNKENGKILEKIAEEEKSHYEFWKSHSHFDVRPNKLKVFFYSLISQIFGLTFGIKLMENGENKANENYQLFAGIIPEALKIAEEEDAHEKKLINILQEEKLSYIGSVVLGLNDALVELTGALAGLSFALQNTRIIALVGLITGVAASLSMAASEYLSTKAEENGNVAVKSALYTGIAYIFTVILLILPYFIFSHYLVCLAGTIIFAILVIFLFNFYISIAKDYDFKKRFTEMLVISLGVAAISFLIGYVIRRLFGIDV
ncbi:MAG: VIT1/CCC1 transporter family protein [Bacteroidales bacterium]|nr:VIT1/CCC1 transporter family protein [Bacteroidales bacterium]